MWHCAYNLPLTVEVGGSKAFPGGGTLRDDDLARRGRAARTSRRKRYFFFKRHALRVDTGSSGERGQVGSASDRHFEFFDYEALHKIERQVAFAKSLRQLVEVRHYPSAGRGAT